MGLFKCKHEIIAPETLVVSPVGWREFSDPGVVVRAKGKCHHCECMVDLQYKIDDRMLYKFFTKKQEEAPEETG